MFKDLIIDGSIISRWWSEWLQWFKPVFHIFLLVDVRNKPLQSWGQHQLQLCPGARVCLRGVH